MMFVIGEFIGHIENNDRAAGQPYRQARNINKSKDSLPSDFSEPDLKIIRDKEGIQRLCSQGGRPLFFWV